MTAWANMTQEQKDRRNAWKRARHAERQKSDKAYVQHRQKYARDFAAKKYAEEGVRKNMNEMANKRAKERVKTDPKYRSKKIAKAKKRYDRLSQDEAWVEKWRPINRDRMQKRRAAIRLSKEYDAFLSRLEVDGASV